MIILVLLPLYAIPGVYSIQKQRIVFNSDNKSVCSHYKKTFLYNEEWIVKIQFTNLYLLWEYRVYCIVYTLYIIQTWQRLVKSRIITPVQFIHDHFPYWMASAGAVLSVSITFMGHSEEQSVRPDRHSTKGSCYRSIINEKLMFHHLKLLVATDPQVRRSNTNNRTIRDVCKSITKNAIGFLTFEHE